MTLPKRNRRKVTAAGIDFYWCKGARGDNGRGVASIQHISGKGSMLMIDPFGQIRGDIVPAAIEFAMQHGWKPLESGPPFWIAYTCIAEPTASFVVRSATDGPFWRDPNRKQLEMQAWLDRMREMDR
ncbi:MAG: hypothetical protein ACK5YR_05190 [Pirellula sp.]|jgi:hypothetical protein